ncbi:DUF998 domain-containing protein [Agromyces sp. SYSU K20354]|uniref:DUF998 domain-containing protein n=1 Tax=Agromyces cavernae TaxID=2898659 RepID=UPI001E58E93E|nr:DUF998 domain-containing protein [Agromyces cavernae]MCD2441478.1 DUF998 domain-containing protein [Agromyces cavernae]
MSTTVPGTSSPTTFDRGRAVTKSLLGWGVMAGPFYLVVGLAQALLVPGFDLSRHALSLLLLGPLGWIQAANLVLSGIMVLAAAVGFARLVPRRPGITAAVLLGLYGVSLFAAALLPPDPMGGFPPGGTDATAASVTGLLHLVAGAIGFLSLAAAAIVLAGWFRAEGRRSVAITSWVAAAVIVFGFMGGAALATVPAGIGLLWLAVVAGWTWLAWASFTAYRMAPRPDR